MLLLVLIFNVMMILSRKDGFMSILKLKVVSRITPDEFCIY